MGSGAIRTQFLQRAALSVFQLLPLRSFMAGRTIAGLLDVTKSLEEACVSVEGLAGRIPIIVTSCRGVFLHAERIFEVKGERQRCSLNCLVCS